MRVTNRYLYYQLVKDIGNNSEKLLELNKQISSAKRISKPSEDPLGMASVLAYRTELNAFDQFQKDIDLANGWLSRTDTILQNTDDLLGRATELATSQASGTATAETRRGAANEIREIRNQLLGLANSKYSNKYMFGGTMTQTAPFLDVDVDKWQADVGMIAAAPPGGASDGDRYIDTGDNHIYQYNGSAWVDFGAPAEGTAVQVTDQNDELYVFNTDLGGWVKQYQGNDDSFAAKIGRTDTVVTNIPGSAVFRSPHGDTFKTLLKLERALKENNQNDIRDALSDLTASSEVISSNLAIVGARVNRLDNTESVLQKVEVDAQERKSKIEDLDYAEAVTALQNQQVIYQATLLSASMITKLSLVDYMNTG
jgi:flagellar hook-associated protein 3 FlgL